MVDRNELFAEEVKDETMIATETTVETQTKKPARRRSYVPGLLRAFQKAAADAKTRIAETAAQEAGRLGEMAAAIEEAIRLDQGNVEQDDERVRAIILAATGGGVERMLRHAPVVEQDDNREFLRTKKWKV